MRNDTVMNKTIICLIKKGLKKNIRILLENEECTIHQNIYLEFLKNLEKN